MFRLVCENNFVCVHVQGCCSEAEAQQAGRMQTTSQPLQCELPTIPLQIGSHFLKGVSFNESAADNLKLKTVHIHFCVLLIICSKNKSYVALCLEQLISNMKLTLFYA